MIRVNALQKSFKVNKKEAKKTGQDKITAVSNVSFSCDKGQVLALLGSNGAGKTTTLRMLSTALEPDQGEIWIGEHPVHQYPRRARLNIGFLSNATPLYRRLTVRENLNFFGRLYQLPVSTIADRILELANSLGFENYLDKKVDHLSTGMAQKASIARCILHNPDLLILDEPTTGLDVEASQQILNFILQQKTAGMSVIFSTHHLNEVELLADKLCVIQSGKTCFHGDLETAKKETGYENLTQVFLTLIGKEVA